MSANRIMDGEEGTASIEFVWSAIVLVFVMMFIFSIFQVTLHGSGGLVNARREAFSAVAEASPAQGMHGRMGMVYTSDVSSTSGNIEAASGCQDDCANKLLFRYTGPRRLYTYGLGSFDAQVNQAVVLYLK